VVRTFPVQNTGAAPLSFAVALTPAGAACGALTASPSDGVLAPGATATVEVRFAASRELAITSATVATLAVSDVKSGRVVQNAPIVASAAAVFSRAELAPAGGLHFGPVAHGTTSTRTLEVRNSECVCEVAELLLLVGTRFVVVVLNSSPTQGHRSAPLAVALCVRSWRL
jgi:hypothetical protein